MTVVAFRHRGEHDVEATIPPVAGVALHLDHEAGEFWLDVALDHNPVVLDAIVASLDVLGFQMDDSDSDDMNADGMVRTYLVEVDSNEHDNKRPALRLA